MPAPYTYYRNAPISTDAPSLFPAQGSTNFSTIEDVIETDHVSFGNANAGHHVKSVYVDAGVPIGVANTVTEYETGNELYFRRGAVDAPIQITNGTPVKAGNGSTFLPGGMKMAWGNANSSGHVANVVTGLSTIYSVTCTVNVAPGTVRSMNLTAVIGGNFAAYTENSSNNFYWVAVGV